MNENIKAGLETISLREVNVNNYKFRTNLMGQLVLQYRAQYRDKWGGRQYRWRDADIGDLTEYYNQLARMQDPRQSIREEFEGQCG